MTVSATNTPIATIPSPMTSTPTSSSKELGEQFLELLVTQLRHQDPLAPQDGTEFLSQLAEMTSVEELTQIRTIMGRLETALAGPQILASSPFITGPIAAPSGGESNAGAADDEGVDTEVEPPAVPVDRVA